MTEGKPQTDIYADSEPMPPMNDGKSEQSRMATERRWAGEVSKWIKVALAEVRKGKPEETLRRPLVQNADLIARALEVYAGASPDSSPIPPERVPEALRELARMFVSMQNMATRLANLDSGLQYKTRCGLIDLRGEEFEAWLKEEASRLEAELAAKGGAG